MVIVSPFSDGESLVLSGFLNDLISSIGFLNFQTLAILSHTMPYYDSRKSAPHSTDYLECRTKNIPNTF